MLVQTSRDGSQQLTGGGVGGADGQKGTRPSQGPRVGSQQLPIGVGLEQMGNVASHGPRVKSQQLPSGGILGQGITRESHDPTIRISQQAPLEGHRLTPGGQLNFDGSQHPKEAHIGSVVVHGPS